MFLLTGTGAQDSLQGVGTNAFCDTGETMHVGKIAYFHPYRRTQHTGAGDEIPGTAQTWHGPCFAVQTMRSVKPLFCTTVKPLGLA